MSNSYRAHANDRPDWAILLSWPFKGLPPSKPVSDQLLDDLSRDITAEFKNAARSVAALYKLSDSKASLLRHRGYLDAIDDLLECISCGGDVENWALTKRAELVGNSQTAPASVPSTSENQQPTISTPPGKAANLDNGLPLDFPFTISLPCPHEFHPSFAPLSVQHIHQQNMQHHSQHHSLNVGLGPGSRKLQTLVRTSSAMKKSSGSEADEEAGGDDENESDSDGNLSFSMHDQSIDYTDQKEITDRDDNLDEEWIVDEHDGSTIAGAKRRFLRECGDKKPRVL
ncbi:hypothetical protein BABINDRAFT_5641 [Babjeviella inositovora NRRL Y-12698]|uniref:Uncharacterized protein n=1 Tax=Babjeviella inositovora NRRL Y-12698 TaxID=984486 RepID=A0A1E3QYL1_9ASCO|nr:uncharacterized protein BABINDRAFT_5641 [Babjeviella inositovora NRRL Y-12698]ODQ82716.1 hypothetical protein BABINDRAFT_5641 [Babjeviella inositovora NRRL Y-12698]